MDKDTIIKIIATDPLAEADFEHYCDQSNYEYLSCEKICNKCVENKQRCPWDPVEDFFKKDEKKGILAF